MDAALAVAIAAGAVAVLALIGCVYFTVMAFVPEAPNNPTPAMTDPGASAVMTVE